MDKNEAIKIIRSNFPTGRNQLCEALETLIPELKKSDDEKIRKELIRAFTVTADKKSHEIYGNGITYGQVLAWLEKQGEQKPAWSGEDEEYLQNIVEWIGCLIDDEDCGDMTYKEHKKFYTKRINWLKSLKERYNWKPSDEQIGTLEQWLRNNRYNGDARYCYPIFDSLHQDLKKLKEE